MRIFNGTAQLNVKHLGRCHNFSELKKNIMALDILSSSTLTNEPVFAGTHRLTAINPLAPAKQKHAAAERSAVLAHILEPQIAHLKKIYVNTTPVLIQCAALPPGSELLWHIDSYVYQNVSHKIHLAISTNLKATYQCRDLMNIIRPYHFKEGQMYEINNILLHRSVNHGLTPRVHVIIDMMHEEQLAKFKSVGADFFFTHHPENKAQENNED